MKNELDILESFKSVMQDTYFSKDWIKKAVLQLNDKEIRMYKIKKIWKIK